LVVGIAPSCGADYRATAQVYYVGAELICYRGLSNNYPNCMPVSRFRGPLPAVGTCIMLTIPGESGDPDSATPWTCEVVDTRT
jgi:hypothetical protein